MPEPMSEAPNVVAAFALADEANQRAVAAHQSDQPTTLQPISPEVDAQETPVSQDLHARSAETPQQTGLVATRAAVEAPSNGTAAVTLDASDSARQVMVGASAVGDNGHGTAILIGSVGTPRQGTPGTVEERADAIRDLLWAAPFEVGQLDDAKQVELPKLAAVLDDVLAQNQLQLLGAVELAAKLLHAGQITAARGIRKNLENQLGRYSIISVLRKNTAPTNVVLGLGTLLVAAVAGVVWLLLPNLNTSVVIANMEPSMLVLVAVAGGIGSIVSIMYRLGQFADGQSSSALLSYFTGLFRPIIGVGFALFVYMILASKLLAVVQPTQGTEPYFFAALAFVAGFVEKLAPDLIDKADKALLGANMPISATVSSGSPSTSAVTIGKPTH